MPYKRNKDLPNSIVENLPAKAQTIFRKAFNNALEYYQNEEQAFKVAWAAVKHVYTKNTSGMWVVKK